MTSLLINEHPLIVLPSLAAKIGLNEAIFLQQVHYWTRDERYAKKHQGRLWVYNSAQGWQKQFPFWCERTIKNIIARLRESGLLMVEKLGATFDRTNFYAINHDLLSSICAEESAQTIVQNLPDLTGKTLHDLTGQNLPDVLPETTRDYTETTPSAALGVSDLVSLGVDKQIAADYQALRKKRKAPLTRTALTAIQREAKKAGIDLAAALEICASRGWTGFKAEWLQQRAGNGSRADFVTRSNRASSAALIAEITGHDNQAIDGVCHAQG